MGIRPGVSTCSPFERMVKVHHDNSNCKTEILVEALIFNFRIDSLHDAMLTMTEGLSVQPEDNLLQLHLTDDELCDIERTIVSELLADNPIPPAKSPFPIGAYGYI